VQRVLAIVSSSATVIGSQITVADTFSSRLFGLMGVRSLGPEEGLWITPSSGVHTCWMKIPIDVVALDREQRVQKIARSVQPWRISCVGLGIRSVLELAPGRAEACGLRLGDQIVFRTRPSHDCRKGESLDACHESLRKQ
jgi:uncharacterized membrane protein (UPF0127 family)